MFRLSLLWIEILLFYRNVLIKKEIIKQQQDILEKIMICVEFFTIGGIIAWNYRSSYISVLSVLAGNLFLPFFIVSIMNANGFRRIFLK